jgi:hypothetical protein
VSFTRTSTSLQGPTWLSTTPTVIGTPSTIAPSTTKTEGQKPYLHCAVSCLHSIRLQGLAFNMKHNILHMYVLLHPPCGYKRKGAGAILKKKNKHKNTHKFIHSLRATPPISIRTMRLRSNSLSLSHKLVTHTTSTSMQDNTRLLPPTGHMTHLARTNINLLCSSCTPSGSKARRYKFTAGVGTSSSKADNR